MNWEKVKTFLIVLFFAINVFLVGFMLNSVKITSSASKTVIEDTAAILNANNISISKEIIPYSIANPGTFDAVPITIDHSYDSPKKLADSNVEAQIKKALAVIDVKNYNINKIDDSTYSVVQKAGGYTVYDGRIAATVENNRISLKGVWYKQKTKPRKSGNADDGLVFVTGVLIDFINNPDRNPSVHNSISSVEVGYCVPQYDSGMQHVSVPVVACYSITTSDGTVFIYEASSGEYLRNK